MNCLPESSESTLQDVSDNLMDTDAIEVVAIAEIRKFGLRKEDLPFWFVCAMYYRIYMTGSAKSLLQEYIESPEISENYIKDTLGYLCERIGELEAENMEVFTENRRLRNKLNKSYK